MQPWYGLLVVVSIILVVLIISSLTADLSEKRLVKLGKIPSADQTTDADIIRMSRSGYKAWAIKRYRQLHHVSLKIAKEKVEAISDSGPQP